ncbi:transcriptional regulator NanR [compost metagenome]
MQQSLNDAKRALAIDREFHTTIADMIGNATLNRFTGLIYDQRMTPYFEKLAGYFEGPHTWQLALEEHVVIRNAIATHDPAAAREAMRLHMTRAQKRFSESFGEESGGEE